MILQRLYDDKLAAASYLVGCQATGQALIVDPMRDVHRYVEAAEREGLRVTHVTETHIHADFVSGSRGLARETGAELLLSSHGGDDWRYRFAGEARATLLQDGDTFRVGGLELGVLHTPGHTPEHISLVLTDPAAGEEPMGVFTGDFVFVGAVGRPDLLETAAGEQGTMEAAARDLFQSLQRFRELPDHLQIWPGHGAGSACGKGMGSVPQSVLGYERMVNPAFAYRDEEEFVDYILDSQPAPPRYFARMKRLNRDGPPTSGELPSASRHPTSWITETIDSAAPVVDTRSREEYDRGHIHATINIPLGRSFTTQAGSILPYDREYYLIVDEARCEEAVTDLFRIGLDRLGGVFHVEAVQTWQERGGYPETSPEVAADEAVRRWSDGRLRVLDVREPGEWKEGHVPGALHIPLGRLADRLDEVPEDAPLVVHCKTGARSAVAASLLRAHDFENVANMRDGFDGWREAGGAVEREDGAGTDG